jgi:hypothetical protein
VSTFLTVVLVMLGIAALLVLMAVLWLRSKVRKGKAYLIYGGLTLAVQALKERAALPEHADDQELAAHLERAQAAETSAKAALDKGDLDEAVKIMLPVLEELAKYKNALDQERAKQAAQAAAQNPGDVIDVEAEVVKPVLELPAPTASSDAPANAPSTGADPATGAAGVSADTTGGVGADASTDAGNKDGSPKADSSK